MILLWVVVVAALAVAVLAWVRTRRLAQRLDQLLQMYWELEVPARRAAQRAAAADGRAPPVASGPDRPAMSGVERPAPPADAFVPLASLKR